MSLLILPPWSNAVCSIRCTLNLCWVSDVGLTNPAGSYVELTDPMAIEHTEMRKVDSNLCLIWAREITLMLHNPNGHSWSQRKGEICFPQPLLKLLFFLQMHTYLGRGGGGTEFYWRYLQAPWQWAKKRDTVTEQICRGAFGWTRSPRQTWWPRATKEAGLCSKMPLIIWLQTEGGFKKQANKLAKINK